MTYPTTRTLALLELLQAHELISGRELARRLGVDGRTVRRYITRLEDLGIPITTERGSFGGYRLVPGFKLPPMMFTDEETLALSIGLLAAEELGLGDLAPGVASLRSKLERVMPAPLRHRVRAAHDTVTLGLRRHAPASADGSRAAVGEHLATLTAAAQSERQVRLHYRSADGTSSERDFDPYGVTRSAGQWYVAGYCHLRKGLRSFRVDRILAVKRGERTFQRPRDFDTRQHLATALASLPRDHTVKVRLDTDLATAKSAIFASLGILTEGAEGVTLTAQTDDLEWMARELASLPFAFEILGPAELITAVRRLAERILGGISGGGATIDPRAVGQ